MAKGGLIGRPKLKTETPSSISLLQTKNGLDNGVHFKEIIDEILIRVREIQNNQAEDERKRNSPYLLTERISEFSADDRAQQAYIEMLGKLVKGFMQKNTISFVPSKGIEVPSTPTEPRSET